MTELFLEYEDETYPLGAAPLTIGSGTGCDVRLAADGVDEEHALVRREGDQVVLESKVHGERDVRVNGVGTYAGEVRSGEVVRFGKLDGSFEVGGDGPALRVEGTLHRLARGVNAIGRSPAAAVGLADESVSREHAEMLILPSGQAWVRDLGSANGTVVNGRRLGQSPLQADDEIKIGSATFHLRRRQAASPPAPVGDDRTVIGARPPGVSAAAAPPKLELELGGERHQLEEGVTRIGRAPDCELVIADDAQVSRYHAELRVTGAEAVLRDLGSSNGTRVNGERLAGEHRLQDGDRIGIGGQELLYSAEIPATPFGATVVAKDLSGMLGQTVVASAGRSARPPRPKGVGILPTDRESALLALDLRADAGEDAIRRRYQELYSEFQIRVTNAPTPELKSTYERRLGELRSAAAILLPQVPAAAGDLPALEPMGSEPGGTTPAVAAAPPPPESPVSPAQPVSASAPAPAAAGTGKRPWSAIAVLPRSALIMIVFAAVLLGGVAFTAVGSQGAVESAAQIADDLEVIRLELEELDAALPVAVAARDELQEGRARLLTNLPLKICNHSSAPLQWSWLHVAWVGRGGRFDAFDSARRTEYSYPSGFITPGSTFSGQWVEDDQVIWGGDAIFFAASWWYRGEEEFRAVAMPAVEGGCYPLALDR